MPKFRSISKIIFFCHFFDLIHKKECANSTKQIVNDKTQYVWSNKFTPAEKILYNRWLRWLRYLEGLLQPDRSRQYRVNISFRIACRYGFAKIACTHVMRATMIRRSANNGSRRPLDGAGAGTGKRYSTNIFSCWYILNV